VALLRPACHAAAAMREVESGSPEQALADVDAALKLAPNRDVRAMAALALARAGDTAAAEKLAAELDKTFPAGHAGPEDWLPMIRAAVALQRKAPDQAVKLLKVASGIELPVPAYLRGEAYLMRHDGSAAAAEFQKFADHRGLVGNSLWGALARLGLARAYNARPSKINHPLIFNARTKTESAATPPAIPSTNRDSLRLPMNP
jgi:eukaryotic-like serine/threonine-protein kinase